MVPTTTATVGDRNTISNAEAARNSSLSGTVTRAKLANRLGFRRGNVFDTGQFVVTWVLTTEMEVFGGRGNEEAFSLDWTQYGQAEERGHQTLSS